MDARFLQHFADWIDQHEAYQQSFHRTGVPLDRHEYGPGVTDLRGADFLRRRQLGFAGLYSFDLRGVDMSETDFTKAGFGDVDLRGACLRGALFRKTMFTNVDARRADFSRSRFDDCDFFDTNNFDGACFDHAVIIQQFDECSFRNTSFRGATFMAARFEELDLATVDFTGATGSFAPPDGNTWWGRHATDVLDQINRSKGDARFIDWDGGDQ